MMRLSLQRRSDPSAAQLGSRQVALSKQEYELEIGLAMAQSGVASRATAPLPSRGDSFASISSYRIAWIRAASG
jgi:hypothetical protein